MKCPKLFGMLAMLLLLAGAGCQSYCERRYPCQAPAYAPYAQAPCCQPAPACAPSYAPVQPVYPYQQPCQPPCAPAR